MNRLKKRFEYQWVIVACCFLMIFTVLGFASTPRKLYMAVVPETLGIDYGPYSLTDSFRYIATAITNLFFGTTIVRFGPRKLIGAGFGLLAGALLLYSAAEALPQIYLAGALLGVGMTFTGTTMSSYAINLWCREKKGTITGLVLCANGLGGAVATQILAPIIHAGAFSYRNAYRLSALILLVVGVVIVLLFRNSPQEDAARPGLSPKKAKAGTWNGMTLQQALRKPYFYAAAVSIFLTGMVLQSIVGSDANHMTHAGLDKTAIAAALSIHSLALALCKFSTGVIYDRKGLRTTMLLCDGAALVTLLLLIFINDSASGRAMAVMYSVISAMALPLETIMLPLITADLFGQKAYAQMLGIVVAVNTAGYSFGPPLTNYIFDAIGTYVPVFWAYVLVMVLVTSLFMYALAAAKREKNA